MMNRYYLQISLSIVLLSLLTVTYNQCMHIKTLSKFSLFRLKQHDKKIIERTFWFTKKNNPENIKKAHQDLADEDEKQSNVDTCSTIKKVKFGPLKDFVPATKLDFPPRKAEPWSDDKIVQKLSVEQFLHGLKELEKIHKAALDEEYNSSDKPSWKQLLERIKKATIAALGKDKPAWKQLDIDNCSKNIPLCRPSNGKPNPKFTMMPGQEKEFTKAMVQLQSNDDETKN